MCCYSVGAAAVTETDSSMKAKRKPAAIRLLAVMSEFWGLCVGQRMLQRAEKDMIKEKATQNILAVPSTRKSMASWLNRRGYSMTSQVDFPVDTVPFEVLPEVKSDLKLLIFEKKFDGQKKAKAR